MKLIDGDMLIEELNNNHFPGAPYVDAGISIAIGKVLDAPTIETELHYDEWCTDCKEYDHEHHSCPRWNRVIRQTVEEYKAAQPEPCEDAVSKEAVSSWLKQYGQDVLHGKYKFSLMYIWKNLMNLPSVTPKQRWIPCSEEPDTDRNVFIARGTDKCMTVCVGHYAHDYKQWYEDRNWFARCLYDGVYWCEMPPLPEPYREGAELNA